MGNIGCIWNYITLTDKQLRRNPCTIYFLCSSIVDFLILNFNLLSRSFHDGFLIDPTQSKSLFYCKFRNYFVISLLILSTSFIIIASIDRWALSSLNVHRRKQRVQPTNPIQLNNNHKRQNQLIRMLLFQVVAIICLKFPYLLTLFYITISKYLYDKYILNQRQQIENLIDLITRDLLYLNYTKSFYLYTLSSTSVRKIFKKTYY